MVFSETAVVLSHPHKSRAIQIVLIKYRMISSYHPYHLLVDFGLVTRSLFFFLFSFFSRSFYELISDSQTPGIEVTGIFTLGVGNLNVFYVYDTR
jgi:hypothetical protein